MKKLLPLLTLVIILGSYMIWGGSLVEASGIIVPVLLIILGIGTLILGGDRLVEGSYTVAEYFSIHPLIIGMTILAMGTSMPELFVNMIAAFRGETGLLLANIVGSNISNLLLIGGITAVIAPLTIKTSTLYKEIPISFGAALLLLLFINNHTIRANSGAFLSRIEGGILLIAFGLFLYQLLSLIKNHDVELEEVEADQSLLVASLSIIAGVFGLYLGGEALVTHSIMLASLFNVSTVLIGASIVAVGTSIPELVTSVIAAMKKHTDMAIGNIIGSNIFNILWVAGLTATIRPIAIQGDITTDILILLLSTILVFILVRFRKDRSLVKHTGIILICLYLCYLVFLIHRG